MLPLTRSGVAASLSRGFIIVGHDPPETLPSSLGGVTMCLSTHCMFSSVLTVAFLPPVNFSLASKPWAQEIIRDQDICTLPHKCLSPQIKKKKSNNSERQSFSPNGSGQNGWNESLQVHTTEAQGSICIISGETYQWNKVRQKHWYWGELCCGLSAVQISSFCSLCAPRKCSTSPRRLNMC